MIPPATDDILPDNCYIKEVMLIKEPRSCWPGKGVIDALSEISLDETPTYKR